MLKRFFTLLRVMPVATYLLIYINHIYPKHHDYSRLNRYKHIRWVVDRANRHMHIDLHVYGKEKLACEQSYLVFPNHQSIVDATIFFTIFSEKEPIAYVSKNQLQKTPGARKIIPSMDGIFIDRGNLKQEVKVVKYVQKSLKNDNLKWIIFPEGTRTKDKDYKLGEFKAGTFKIAMSIDKNIYPVAIYGTHRVLDKHIHMKKYPVYVKFLDPITPEFYKNKTTQEVAKYTEEIIQREVDKFIELDKNKLEKSVK